MILILNIAIISILFLIFYQDMKERKVMLLLLVILFIVSGLLHSRFQVLEYFLLNIAINFCVVACILFILFLYTRFMMKTKLFTVFGMGDLLFFLVLAVSFPTPVFLVMFSSSLLFAFIISTVLKKTAHNKAIPLAGFQALFMMLIMISNLIFKFTNLYSS